MIDLTSTCAATTENKQVVPETSNRWIWLAPLALLIGTGTGLATAIFGLFHGLLAVDGRNDQVLVVFHSKLESRRVGEFSYSELEHLKNASSLFADAAAYSPVPVTVNTGASEQQDVPASFISPSYFRVLGSKFLLGRDLFCAAKPCRQTILAQRLWREQFASNPALVGNSILIDGQKFTVQGVLAEDAIAVDAGRDPMLWIPVEAEPALLSEDWTNADSKVRWLLPVVQLRHGITPVAAQKQMEKLFADPASSGAGFMALTPGQAKVARAFRIRGALVQTLGGSFLTVAFWAFLFVWPLALNLLVVYGAGRKISWPELLVVAMAGTAIVFPVNIIVKVVLDASLRLFGTPIFATRLYPGWQTFGGIALTIACAGLIAHLCDLAARTRVYSVASARSLLNTGWARKFKDHRYLVLCAVLLALIAGYTANGLCVSDFWEHAAVVRELAAHPLHPSNPILPVAAPHAGYSPYTLAVALLCRGAGLSAVDGTRLAGILNVLFLVCALGVFVRAAFPAKDTDFYALLFALVLWGFFPWYSSGFLHLNVLGQIASYPSIFATATLFFAWYLSILVAKGRRPWLAVALICVVASVCLNHPLTAIPMFVGLFALTLDFGRSWFSLAQLAVVCIVAFLLACAWPYFDIRALLLSRTGHFDIAASGMYPGIVKTIVLIFPALVGLPLLLGRFRANRRDFVVLTFVLLLLIYVLGGLTGKWTLGRVIAFTIVMLQLAVADWFARDQAERVTDRSSGRRWTRAAVIAAAALGSIMMLPGILSSIPIFQNSYGEYKFLPKYLSEQNTVLADFDSSLRIPAFGPKVVAYHPEHILFFVDSDSRISDNQRFFSDAATDWERKRILEKYQTRFLLLDKRTAGAWPSVLRSLPATSSVLYSDGDVLLLQVK